MGGHAHLVHPATPLKKPLLVHGTDGEAMFQIS